MATRRKEIEIVKEAQNVFKTIKKFGRWIAGAMAVIVIGTWAYKSISEYKDEHKKKLAEIPAVRVESGRGEITAPVGYLSTKGALFNPKFGSCAPQGLVRVVPFVPQEKGPPILIRGDPFEDGPEMLSHHKFPQGTIWRYESLTGKPVQVLCSVPVVDV